MKTPWHEGNWKLFAPDFMGSWIKWILSDSESWLHKQARIGPARKHLNLYSFDWQNIDWPGLSGQNGEILAAFFLVPMGLARRSSQSVILLGDQSGNWIREAEAKDLDLNNKQG